MCNEKWTNNAIQFPRLLVEIMATQELDIAAIADEMDLTVENVIELFDRANDDWEAAKAGMPMSLNATTEVGVRPTQSESYWRDAMLRRMPFNEEVTRLVTVLYGFHARSEDGESLLEFYDSKRPYGNKNIPDSIAFNLGWDFARRLCVESMPDWVAEEANKLHAAVFAKLAAE